MIATPWFTARGLLAWLALLASFIGVAYASYAYSMQTGVRSLRESANQRLEVYEGSLETILSRYDYLPRTLELNADVIALLERPGDPVLVGRTNRLLAQVNDQARANVIYVLDLQGIALASSNWNQTNSFAARLVLPAAV